MGVCISAGCFPKSLSGVSGAFSFAQLRPSSLSVLGPSLSGPPMKPLSNYVISRRRFAVDAARRPANLSGAPRIPPKSLVASVRAERVTPAGPPPRGFRVSGVLGSLGGQRRASQGHRWPGGCTVTASTITEAPRRRRCHYDFWEWAAFETLTREGLMCRLPILR